MAATLLYHIRVEKWDVRVDGLILEVSVWHPHHGMPVVELPNCTPLPMIQSSLECVSDSSIGTQLAGILMIAGEQNDRP